MRRFRRFCGCFPVGRRANILMRCMSHGPRERTETLTGHQHEAHGHGHGAPRDADWRWLAAATALIVAFMAGEVVAGLVAHSLALLSDAAHMLTDAAAIGLALVTARVAGR